MGLGVFENETSGVNAPRRRYGASIVIRVTRVVKPWLRLAVRRGRADPRPAALEADGSVTCLWKLL